MPKNNKKRTLWEDAALIRKGYRLIVRLAGKAFIVYRLFTGTLSALHPFVNIYLSARILDELSSGCDPQTLIALALITVTANLVVQLLEKVFSQLAEVRVNTFHHRYRMLFSEKIMEMDYEDVENTAVQSIRGKIAEMDNWMGRGVQQLFWHIDGAVRSVVQVIAAAGLTATLFTTKTTHGGAAAAFLDSPVLIFILAVCMAGLALLTEKLSKGAQGTVDSESEHLLFGNRLFTYLTYGLLEEVKTGKDIRLYRMADILDRLLSKMSAILMKSYRSAFIQGTRFQAANKLVSPIIPFIAYILAALKAFYGAFGPGSLVQYVGAITQLGMGVNSVFGIIGWLRGNNDYLAITLRYLDIPNKKYMGTIPVEKRNDNEYEIEFRDVSFHYPGSSEWVLKDFSLKFKIGGRIAVVGMNGSGKTTMIKLLCRLYDPAKGEILLNGIDIRKYDYEEYMKIFSVVFQDFKLFAFELGQNVAASVDYDKDMVKQALEEAGYSKTLHQMPAGLQSFLYRDFDGNGVDISGGEAQKVAIARALYKKAPFIILDEPTAALDPIAEAEIYAKFNEIVEDRTAVYISHRLSSCRFCDRIIVLDKGRLVQEGRHDTLVSDKTGKYYELWQAQAQYYQ